MKTIKYFDLEDWGGGGGANYANQQKESDWVEFNAEQFGNYTAKFSQKDKFDAIALLLCQVPMPIEDLQDIVDILKENQDRVDVRGLEKRQ
jgi:hypothetical protein